MLTRNPHPDRVARSTSRPPLLLRANLLGIPLGLVGLTQCWSASRSVLTGMPAWPVDLLWILSAATWAVVTIGYVHNASTAHRLSGEPADPTFGPFTAIAVIVPMMLGVALAEHAPTAGRAVFLTGLVLTVGYGGWLSGQWILSDLRLEQWHPGYFLPTVAGGLVAAAGGATLGYAALARLMFGYGMLCWLALGSIVLARLFVAPALPTALTPTMAIEVAPPVVAGNAWLAINGGRMDLLALCLAGYAVLMLAVQLRLTPVYARLSFAPSWWAFSFSYAAAAAFAMRWLAIDAPAYRTGAAIGLLGLTTLGIGALVVRTIVGLVEGTFLPRAAVV